MIKLLKKEKIRSLLAEYKYKPYSWIKNVKEKNLLNFLQFDISTNRTIILKDKNKIKGLLCFKRMDWDCDYFGYEVYALKHLIATGNYQKQIKIKDKLLKNFFKICKSEKIKFIQTRVHCADLSTVHSLENNGFNLITTELFFAWEKSLFEKHKIVFEKEPCVVRNYKKEDLPELLNLAKYFTTNRLYLDENISLKSSIGVYKEWIKNACMGIFSGTDEVLVGEKDGKICAFTTTKLGDKVIEKFLGVKLGIPGLVAVSPEFRGRGINPYIMSKAIESLFQKISLVVAPSHITNLVMIKSESKIGAELVLCEYIFHKWIK